MCLLCQRARTRPQPCEARAIVSLAVGIRAELRAHAVVELRDGEAAAVAHSLEAREREGERGDCRRCVGDG